MATDYGYWDMGTGILRTIAKVAGYGIKGGRMLYTHHQIKEDAEQYQAYERAAKNPPAPFALQGSIRSGVFFGKHDCRCIRKPQDMDGHVLVIGGTGSGKTSCIAIPTLRAWGGRVFAIDIKGELYDRTIAYRPDIHIFNPLQACSYGYDPYYTLKDSRNAAQEAKAIAQALIPRPPDIKDPFWVESAQNLLTGAILHFYNEGLSFIDTIKAIQRLPQNSLIEEIAQSNTKETRYYINNFVGMADKTLSGIVSELSRNIVTIAADKDLVDALSRNKIITPADLENGADVYIQIPEHLLEQWNPIVTLIVNQFLSYFEQRRYTDTTPILFLLDEFPRLGRIPAIQNGLATLRSRKVTLCLVIQNIAQLSAIYGRDNANVILGNCDYKAVLGASDYDTQRYLSAMCGLYIKRMASAGYQAPLPMSVNEGAAEQFAPIIPEADFGIMNDIVLINPLGEDSTFCRVEKEPYYNAWG
ncbi:MAG: type IV secretory system conjugative DNA transfer family protein [Clostridiales bacterium]|nr:type IV secretory system conjugative DNA transfer family protein [Clostridiales bacterium]